MRRSTLRSIGSSISDNPARLIRTIPAISRGPMISVVSHAAVSVPTSVLVRWTILPSSVAEAAKNAAQAHLTATTENRFLLDWYGEKREKDADAAPRDAAATKRAYASLPLGTTSCSHPLCGRVETRRHEFRRCSCCGRVRYCSRSCQGADWRLQHKFACLPLLELYGWAESDAESAEDEASAGVPPEEAPVLAQPCV